MSMRWTYVSSRKRECGTSGATTTINSTSDSSSLFGKRQIMDSQMVLMSSAIGRQTVSPSLSSLDQSSTLFVTVNKLAGIQRHQVRFAHSMIASLWHVGSPVEACDLPRSVQSGIAGRCNLVGGAKEFVFRETQRQ